jgi:WD40 repeat protein
VRALTSSQGVKGIPAEWGACYRTVSLETWSSRPSHAKQHHCSWFGLWEIIVLDAITGSQAAVLSGHTDCLMSVVFHQMGNYLYLEVIDKTVRLWDVQTGGVIEFHDSK